MFLVDLQKNVVFFREKENDTDQKQTQQERRKEEPGRRDRESKIQTFTLLIPTDLITACSK